MTNNDISGITVTNTDTLESHVSVCGATSFSGPPGSNTFTFDAGPGTDCVTTDVNTYVPESQGPLAPGAYVIGLTRV